MKTYDYEPKGIKNKDGTHKDCVFKGKIVIEVPTYKERLDIAKSIGMDDKTDDIDKGKKVLETVEKHVKSIELQSEEHSLVITDMDDLGSYMEGTEIINQLGQLLMQGIPLGEN